MRKTQGAKVAVMRSPKERKDREKEALLRELRARIADHGVTFTQEDWLFLGYDDEEEPASLGLPKSAYDGAAALDRKIHVEQMLANARLTEDEKNVVRCKFMEGPSEATFNEVAGILGDTPAAVKKLFTSAMQKLRQAR